ncbi:hypothetical protein RRG08_014409 [Elysia crispata]|uniref:Uncharacterized protein n=1 Tax=Elysia crispata TaxID=231223 RepID=A0AAE0YV60_9GAST|nr:hypothetical protein RRG08_014409 [Elysia crispata]
MVEPLSSSSAAIAATFHRTGALWGSFIADTGFYDPQTGVSGIVQADSPAPRQTPEAMRHGSFNQTTHFRKHTQGLQEVELFELLPFKLEWRSTGNTVESG